MFNHHPSDLPDNLGVSVQRYLKKESLPFSLLTEEVEAFFLNNHIQNR